MNLSKLAGNSFIEYKQWVRAHPTTLSEMESALRYVSYLFANQLENSNLISELIYSLSKLLVFFNDQIIYGGTLAADRNNPYHDKLKKWLTIIEYCEVFIELTAQRTWGTRGKWIMVTIVQIFKSLIRLCLLFYKKEQIVEPTPIHFLDRKNLHTLNIESYMPKEYVELRSGRVIRTVEAALSSENRQWNSFPRQSNYAIHDKKLNRRQINGEILYICKPLLHLSSLYFFGTNSWKPWMFSLLLDVVSINMLAKTSLKSSDKFSRRQQIEINRRSMALFWYLMRSPFYDYKTKKQIISTLQLFSRVPLVGIFCKSLIDYLPQWQQTYFYLWSS